MLPKLSGKKFLQKMFPENHLEMCRSFGQIFDWLQVCKDQVLAQIGWEPYCPHPLEEEIFIKEMHTYFFVSCFCNTLCTVQLKILSAGNEVDDHFDTHNC